MSVRTYVDLDDSLYAKVVILGMMYHRSVADLIRLFVSAGIDTAIEPDKPVAS